MAARCRDVFLRKSRPGHGARGARLGAPAVVVMPTTAPAIKIEGAKAFGAEVILEGTTSAHRRARARRRKPRPAV